VDLVRLAQFENPRQRVEELKPVVPVKDGRVKPHAPAVRLFRPAAPKCWDEEERQKKLEDRIREPRVLPVDDADQFPPAHEEVLRPQVAVAESVARRAGPRLLEPLVGLHN